MWYDLDDPSGLGGRGAPDFGIEHTHFGPPRPLDELFWTKMIHEHFIYNIVASWVLEIGFGETLLLKVFLRKMAKIAYLTNHWVFSLHFFCNDICCYCYMNAKSLKKHSIRCSGWSVVKTWVQKVGFTPRLIRYGPHNGQFSRSSGL